MIDISTIEVFNNQAKEESQCHSVPCTENNCLGDLKGELGGKFVVKEHIYTQLLRAKCDRCTKEASEVFEVEDIQGDEYWISEEIVFNLSPVDTSHR